MADRTKPRPARDLYCTCLHKASIHFPADNYPGVLVCCTAWCPCRELIVMPAEHVLAVLRDKVA